MDGFLPVKVSIPLHDYRRLHAEARAAGITVAQHIARMVTAPPPKPRSRAGRPSAYTTHAGEEIAEARRFGKSWEEIGLSCGIAGHTAKDWHGRYQNEVREQNMRDRAGRKAS